MLVIWSLHIYFKIFFNIYGNSGNRKAFGFNFKCIILILYNIWINKNHVHIQYTYHGIIYLNKGIIN